MKNRFNRVPYVLMAATMLATAIFTGCGTSSSSGGASPAATSTAKSPTADFVKLSWYVRFDDQKDTQQVNTEVNKLIKQKINAEVEVKNIPGASYNDKMQIILASGENADVVFTGNGYADYYGNVTKGAFLPLDDLIKQYGTKSFSQVPARMWDAVKVNGKIYGMVNYQIEAKEGGFSAQKALLDKYNFDLTKCKKLEDIEPFLEKVKQGESGIVPFVSNIDASYIIDAYPDLGFDEIGARYSPGVVAIGDKDLKVINQFEMKPLQERIKLMRKWYLAGYINKDAPTLKFNSDLLKAGKVAASWGGQKPGGEAEIKAMFGDRDVTVVKTMEGRLLTSQISASLQAISKTSKNPERAMMFIELLNTDKDIYNMLCFGVEGTHYKKVNDKRIELLPNSGYYPNKAWAMGNQFNAYLYGTQVDTVWDDTKKLNEAATKSDALGFNFDATPVKAELAQCQTVIDQYFAALYTGSVDPDKYLPEFLSKLKAAGSDKVIAEKQKQIDAWKKSK